MIALDATDNYVAQCSQMTDNCSASICRTKATQYFDSNVLTDHYKENFHLELSPAIISSKTSLNIVEDPCFKQVPQLYQPG